MTDLAPELLIGTRGGLPADLRYLADKYPRETWNAHENLGGMAQFWLQRHNMFRELGEMLNGAIGDYREGRVAVADFANWFAPRLQFFLQQLHGHHQIEDIHYFPVFAKAEKRLRHGFDILDSDHTVIHGALEANAVTANEFLRSFQQDSARQMFAADAYAEQNKRLVAMLNQHLADEEDLIIPLILDRGEEELGVA